MFNVWIETSGEPRKVLTQFETEAEAEDFCREFGWLWEDDNYVVWDMSYEDAAGAKGSETFIF